jgi:hypothetical protein
MVFAMIVGGYVLHFVPDSWQEGFILMLKRGGVIVCALLIALVIFIVIQVKSSEIQPFIYFQF